MPPRTLPNGFPNASRTLRPNAPERRPNTPAHTHYYYVIPGAAPRVAPHPTEGE